ncbi:MAG: hypothetical protein GF401_01915 [Chitinivibrionales bacterium]|nr:hypothetical protein [Chitinivibrionales bacterium]
MINTTNYSNLKDGFFVNVAAYFSERAHALKEKKKYKEAYVKNSGYYVYKESTNRLPDIIKAFELRTIEWMVQAGENHWIIKTLCKQDSGYSNIFYLINSQKKMTVDSILISTADNSLKTCIYFIHNKKVPTLLSHYFDKKGYHNFLTGSNLDSDAMSTTFKFESDGAGGGETFDFEDVDEDGIFELVFRDLERNEIQQIIKWKNNHFKECK